MTLLASATPVHGAWGSGRLLRTSLVSVLMTDQGSAFIGAVEPSVLYAAASGAVRRDTLTAISTSGLTKRFRGGQLAVDHIDLAVPDGSVYGFLGPNGSGKTTTIRMLLGLAFPTAGQAALLEVPMPAGATRVLHRVGSLVEGPAFYPFLTGRRQPGQVRRRRPDRRPADGAGQDRGGPGPGGPAHGGEEAVPQLLPGHEAAAGHRRGPAAPA